MSLKLVMPDKKYLESVYEVIAEYKSSPLKFSISDVREMMAAAENDFKDYFERVKNESLGIGLKNGYVPQTTYWLTDGDEYVGTFALRHRLTPDLEKIGGHIAYAIRPLRRRQGYGYKGLKLCLKKAFEKGLDKVLITCDKENTASYNLIHKVMIEYGGVEMPEIKVKDVIERRVWVYTKKSS